MSTVVTAMVCRRQNEIAIGRRIAPRLSQHSQSQLVRLVLEIGHLLEHGRAGDIQDATDDDPAGLATHMGVDRLDHAGYTHLLPISL
jgi:hypothetical protein